MHHFLHDPTSSKDGHRQDRLGDYVDKQYFRCSAPQCPAVLVITMRPPRLQSEWIGLLTDTSKLKARAEKAMRIDPERFQGHAIPSPSQTLINLQTYISNAMKSSEVRKIQYNNKKWVLNFGEDCDELLTFLGFTHHVGYC